MTRPCLMLMIGLSLSGCALRNWMVPPAPFSERAPCVLGPSLTKEQLVAHLNKNIQGSATSSGLASWRSMSCKISATGMPPGISVPASIAVEAPRNFRLRVSEPLTRVEALDMGSNHEHFWFWAKDAQPQQVMTISHHDLPAAQRELQVPFHPDWLMEVLGVIPLDPAKFTLQRGRSDAPTYELVSEVLSPAGETTRKVIRVDACHGIVREHALYDIRGILIARAALADHRVDQTTGLVIPHVVSFDWPAMRQNMKMVFNAVELNPPHLPPQLWQVPEKPGAPRFDLSQLLNNPHHTNQELYGRGSPFGIIPPIANASVEQAGHAATSAASSLAQPVSGSSDWAFTPPDPVETGNAAQETPRSSRAHLTHRPHAPAPDFEQQRAYSPAASQSSSAPRRREPALWQWPER